MTNNQRLKELTDKYGMRPVDVWVLLDSQHVISPHTVFAWFKTPEAGAYRNMTDAWLERFETLLTGNITG